MLSRQMLESKFLFRSSIQIKRPLAGMRVSMASGIDKWKRTAKVTRNCTCSPRGLSESNPPTDLRLYVRTLMIQITSLCMSKVHLIKSKADDQSRLSAKMRSRDGSCSRPGRQHIEKIVVASHDYRMLTRPKATTSADGRFCVKMTPGKHTLVMATDKPGFDYQWYRSLQK